MKFSKYYIDSTFCRIHNKKTAALSEMLKKYNNTLVEFNEESGFTPEVMLKRLEGYVAEINNSNRGRDVVLRMERFCTCDNVIRFSFIDNPNTGEAVAGFTLFPVKRIVDLEEML